MVGYMIDMKKLAATRAHSPVAPPARAASPHRATFTAANRASSRLAAMRPIRAEPTKRPIMKAISDRVR